MSENDVLANLIILLADYLKTHADSLSGKALFLFPVITTVIGGVTRYAWLLPIVRPFIGPAVGLYGKLTAKKDTTGETK